MAVTIKNIKKWYLMLIGKSVLHVNQDIGKHFQKDTIKGYYNNMKEKVTLAPDFLDNNNVPVLKTEKGGIFYYPVGIFQYAFGLLDIYYENQEEKYLCKFKHCADWALDNQEQTGAWDNFSYYYPKYPYSAMAQGEGASLLLRAYSIYKDRKYLEAAKKAIEFMLIDAKDGGCTAYENEDVILVEYTHRKAVMNGWIFAWWGLYDYVLVSKDEKMKHLLFCSLRSIISSLPKFSNTYWSLYDLEGRIASPFYHNLHIAQMQAMYQLTDQEIFKEYAILWIRQKKNPLFKGLAFINKAFQKIIER